MKREKKIKQMLQGCQHRPWSKWKDKHKKPKNNNKITVICLIWGKLKAITNSLSQL